MSERFIKFIPSEETKWLIKEQPNAFILLTHIAENASIEVINSYGLLFGQCHIGNLEKIGLTQQEYRYAKKILLLRKHIKIIETCRTRKKSSDGNTTRGTLVQIISSNVYDIRHEVKHG